MNTLNKIFIASMMLFLSVSLFSQQKLAEYKSFGKTYEIRIAKREGNSYRLYIEMNGFGGYSEYGGIYLDEKTHPLFLESLNGAKLKYVEWDSIATINKVVTHTQPMVFNPTCGAFFMHGSQVHFDFSVDMSFNFNVVDSTPYLVVKTSKLVSQKNENITSIGYILIFHSPKELENFATLISVNRVNEFLNPQKTSELFKN